MDVKIIAPIKDYIKEFTTPEEFDMWYKMNKNEMDSITTHKLNKLYHINGYRITKIKGVLMLKKVKEQHKSNIINEDSDTEIRIMETKIMELEDKIIDIQNEMNDIKIAIHSVQQYFNLDP